MAGTCTWDKIITTLHTAVQRVHATESAFQPITNNDQNSSRSCIREKSTWWPWIVEFALIGIDEKAYYYINDVDG